MSHDIETIKTHARGHWLQILRSVCGFTELQLTPERGQPCPKCYGTDRFSMFKDAAETGGAICRGCFKDRNGDGLAVICWHNEVPLKEAIRLVADWLNITEDTRPAVRPAPKREPEPAGPTFPTAAAAIAGFGRGAPDMQHAYRTAAGELTMVVCRWGSGKTKTIRPVSLRGSEWVQKATEGQRVLYNLPAVLLASTVYLTEGEKAADALSVELGTTTTTSPNGSSAVNATDWALLDWKTVVLMPDNDEAGEEYCKAATAAIKAAAPNATIAVARLKDDWPDIPHKGDAADWLEQFDTAEVSELLSRLVNITKHGGGIRNSRMGESELQFIADIGNPARELIKSGIEPLDSAIGGGFAKGETVILAARPSHGKSLVSLQILQNERRRGIDSLMVTEEMTADALAKRSLMFNTDIPESEWQTRKGELLSQLERRNATSGEIHVAEFCGNVQNIENQVRHYVSNYGVRVVAVDYVQLVTSGEQRKIDDVAKVSEALARLAKELGIIMVLSCQMNRAIESRPVYEPRMSDIRETGQLEQDADVIIFFVYSHKLDPDKYPRDEYWAYISKNRNRDTPTPVVKCHIDPSRQKIGAAARDWENAADAFS